MAAYPRHAGSRAPWPRRWNRLPGHRQELAPERLLYADALIVSDDLVLRETNAVDSSFLSRETGARAATRTRAWAC